MNDRSRRGNTQTRTEKTALGAFIALWAVALGVGLAFWGLLIWLLVVLIHHFS